MPTGYTHKIKDGQSFEDFVLGCARAFGALVLMRDEPSDAPIPERFEPSDYHVKERDKAKEQYRIVSEMTEAEAEEKAEAEYTQAMTRYNLRVLENNNEQVMYKAMLAKVRAWQAPSTHADLKRFMIEQLEKSKDFDNFEPDLPKQISGRAWKANAEANALRDIGYHTTEYAKEVERVEGRNKWIKDLRDSLKAKEPA
jgi:hypothetical protein